MTDRRKYKQWNYALFYFNETNEVAIGKTSLVIDGYKNLTKGGYIKLLWPGDSREYVARVLDLAGWFFLLESNLQALLVRVKIPEWSDSVVQRCAIVEWALGGTLP